MGNGYIGISYSHFLDNKWIHKLWKKFMCSRGRHLLDEVWSPGSGAFSHYLYCDACGPEAHIKDSIK